MKRMVAAALLFALAIPAAALAADPVTADLKVFRVTEDAQGKEVLTPVTEVAQGDIVEYQVIYTNHTEAAITQLSPLLPIPGELCFLPETALPVVVLASTDGAQFAPVPLQELVVLPDGTKQERPIPVQRYRMLKWQIGTLDAGSSIQVSARMQVGSELLSQNQTAPEAVAEPGK